MATVNKYLTCKWVHIEIARGDSADNYNYCSRLTTVKAINNDLAKDRLSDAVELSKTGRATDNILLLLLLLLLILIMIIMIITIIMMITLIHIIMIIILIIRIA